MRTKPYQIPETKPNVVAEPAVAYVARSLSEVETRSLSEVEARSLSEAEMSNGWNPNVPFHGTQEEWWEHFHRIEEGNFMSLEEFDQKFEKWRKEYLTNKLK